MTSPIEPAFHLPQFRVSAISPLGQHGNPSNEFELSGTFSRLEGVSEGSCFLLTSEQGALIGLSGELQLLAAGERAALFHTTEGSMPDVVGRDLAYVNQPWEPHHVWMVTEPGWKWNRTPFQALDVISRKIRDDKASLLDGQEVWDWIEIKKIGEAGRHSRYYPVFPDGRMTLPPAEPDGVIRGGWSHEHCELCEAHIESGNYGYLDLGAHWICEECYGNYVVPHDLSFMNP